MLATPVLDLSSVRGPQGYADRSGYGNWGVPGLGPCNARGVFDECVRFHGVFQYISCGSNVSLDIGGDISVGFWVNSTRTAFMDTINKANGANLGWGMWLDAAGRAYGLFYGGGVSVLQGISVIVNKWSHVLMTAQGTVGRLFVDGLQEDRKAVTMSSADAVNLYIGGPGFAAYYNGSIELPQVWNGALSPEQVYRNYLQASQVPIYYDTFESYAVTPVAKAVGSMCGPFRVAVQSMVITAGTSGKKWVYGGLHAGCAGTGDWTENNAYGTWEFDLVKGTDAWDLPYLGFICNIRAPYTTAGLNGYMFTCAPGGGLIIYRVFNGAIAAAPFTSSPAVLSLATVGRCRITRRVGGQFTIYIKGGVFPDWTLVEAAGGTTNPFTDNTYTSGQFFNGAVTDLDGLSNITRTRTCERPASFPWEFSATGTWAGLVSASTIWMRCLTSGNVYLPKDLDWQTCDLKLYKGADANVTDVLLVATELGGATAASQNGYCLRLSADERVQLCRIDNGVVTVLVQTAAAYVAITTEYSFHVTRVGTTGAFVVSILGGAYATWTEAVTVTDNTYTMGNYFNVDIDADDRITAPVFAGSLKASV